MRLLPAWLIGGNDHELARDLANRAASKQRQRGSMGRPHRNAADADRAGWAWWDSRR